MKRKTSERFLVTFCVDTAENGPRRVCDISWHSTPYLGLFSFQLEVEKRALLHKEDERRRTLNAIARAKAAAKRR